MSVATKAICSPRLLLLICLLPLLPPSREDLLPVVVSVFPPLRVPMPIVFSGSLPEAAVAKYVERAIIVGLEVRGDVAVIAVGAISNLSIELLCGCDT